MIQKAAAEKRDRQILWGGILTTALVTGVVAGAYAFQTIPKYTVITVVLHDALSSKTAKAGQTFLTHCPDACGGFPSKTEFIGTITEAKGKTSKEQGIIRVKFLEAVLPDETKVTIDATVAPPDPERQRATEAAQGNGRRGRGGAGQGAAAGALFGAAVANNDSKGALIGAGVGAVAGGAERKRQLAGKELEVKAGQRFQIILNKAVTLGGGGGGGGRRPLVTPPQPPATEPPPAPGS